MRNLLQRTIKDSITCTGIGLHSGEMVRLTLRPASAGTGIVFQRVDLPNRPEVKANLENVIHTRLATTLGQGGVVVATVEHLLAAVVGSGLDNLRIELSGPEVPIMDGSSAPFVHLIKSVGVKTLNALKKFVVVNRPLIVADGDKFVKVEPDRHFSVHYAIDFDHPLIQRQSMDFAFHDMTFEAELSRARTFGFLHEVEWMKRNGFARGGSLDNAVVIDRFRILNRDGLRYENEFIRHKVLDFIGDISLIGAPIIGRFTASKSGHTLNHQLLTELKNQKESWELVEFSHPTHCQANNISVPSWGLGEVAPRQAAA